MYTQRERENVTTFALHMHEFFQKQIGLVRKTINLPSSTAPTIEMHNRCKPACEYIACNRVECLPVAVVMDLGKHRPLAPFAMSTSARVHIQSWVNDYPSQPICKLFASDFVAGFSIDSGGCGYLLPTRAKHMQTNLYIHI